jgi:1,2-diacylglycerol 3-alpha-glucosyltransferase
VKILINGTTYFPSLNGQAIFMTNLAEGLARRGHEVTAAFPSFKSAPYQEEHNGVQLEHLRSIPLTLIHPNAWITAPTVQDVAKIFDRAKPDVLHIQDHYPPTGQFVREARRRGVHVMGTNHFMPENLAPYVPVLRSIKPVFNWVLWKWMLLTYNRTELVTAQSHAAAELVQAAGLRPPVYPVSCGIDLKRFHPDPSIDREACRLRYGLDLKRTIFLYVGRVDREKRLDVLLRAMKLLKRDDVQLAVAGRGAATNEYQALAKHLELGERVVFTGFIPNEDLHVLLNSVDVFTMPSEAELLSIASLEAMACGRPLLLANAVALPELVQHGVNGFLFEPGDPADAARCMEELADHPEHWAAMGRASLQRAQVHGLERTIARYEELYQSL